MTDRILYTCAEAAALMGLGRSLVYQLVMRGDLHSIKLGRARRIPAKALDEYVQRLQSEQCERYDEKPREVGDLRPDQMSESRSRRSQA